MAVFVLYSLAGFFLVPAVVKSQLRKHLPALLQRGATVREVKFNPYVLSLTVRGLTLSESNGLPFVSWEELYANFQMSSLFRWTWTFDEIRLTDPWAQVILGRDGRFNFADILESSTSSPAPPAAIPPVLVFDLTVTNGHVVFADLLRKTPFRTAYTPINIHLTRFTTRPNDEGDYAFESSSDTGRRVAWSGRVSIQPLAARGALQLSGIQLPKHAPYAEDHTLAEIAEGTLDLAAQYSFAYGTNGMDLTVTNLTMAVTNLQLRDPTGGETVIRIPSYELRQGSADWRTRTARLGQIVIRDFEALLQRQTNGAINLFALWPGLKLRAAAPPPPDAPSHPGWTLDLDEYRLERGTIRIEDLTVPGPFRSTVRPLNVSVQDFSTRRDAQAAIKMELAIEDGSTVTVAAQACINPLHARGRTEVKGLDLPRYQPYFASIFAGVLAAGQTDATLDFTYRLDAGTNFITVSNLTTLLSGLKITEATNGERMIEVPELRIEDGSGSLVGKSGRIGSIATRGGFARAQRSSDGQSVDLIELFPDLQKLIEPFRHYSLALDRFTARDYGVLLVDKHTPQKGAITIDQIAVDLAGLRFPSNAPVHAVVSARLNEAGTVKLQARVEPYSPRIEADVAVTNLNLVPFQPWVDPLVKLTVSNGELNTQGRVLIAPRDPISPTLRFTGDVTITNFVTIDQVLFKEFVRWDHFALRGLKADLLPKSLAIDQVAFEGLKTSVVLGPDRRPNLLAILPDSAATNAPPARAAATPASPIPLQVGELKLHRAAFHFADQSISPPCAFDVQQFGGTLRELSSREDSTAALDLSGHVDERSPFSLRGRVNPLARTLQMDLTFTNTDTQLTPFTPYMEKYAGFPLQKGRVSVALRCAVHDLNLKADTSVRLDQLTLGPRNNSPDATKLPVKFAIALLKDRHGQIALDVPLSGRLDDPQFSIGPLVLKVVVNLLTRAATSPFALLGALVGGGEELSYVDFEPGSAALAPAETAKLDKLAQALYDRPAVNVEISGGGDPLTDRPALARAQVLERIKTLRLTELAQGGAAPQSVESFQIATNDYERLIQAEFARTFGTNQLFATETNLSPTTMTASATPNPSPSATVPTASPPPARNRPETLDLPKGATLLTIWKTKAGKSDTASTTPVPAPTAPGPATAPSPETPAVETPLTPAEMESRLAATIDVREEDLRRLHAARARAVQGYLLKTERVTTDRLFLIAPRPIDPNGTGQRRVNLSLN